MLRGPDELTGVQLSWIAALRPEPDVTVALVMVPPQLAAQVGPALGGLLEQMAGHRLVLAMSGAGLTRAGRVPMARQIAEDWNLTVTAPAGDVVLAPGGLLFVGGAEPGQWWTYSPGRDARPEGPRWPEPDWAAADDVMSLGTLELRPVPAGMLLCGAGSPASATQDVAGAVPVRRDRPALLCALGDDRQRHLPGAIALLSLLLQHQSWTRHPLLMIPADGTDVLPLGQALSRELSLGVEVLSGVPLGGDRVVLTGASGRTTWSPFVTAVLCRPDAAAPAPLLWRAPLDGLAQVDPVRPRFALTPDLHLSLTRAGLWLHQPGDRRNPGEDAAVDAESARLDIGAPDPGLPHDFPDLATGLDRLITALPAATRGRQRLIVHAALTTPARTGLADVAARHHLPIEFTDTTSAWAPPAAAPEPAAPHAFEKAPPPTIIDPNLRRRRPRPGGAAPAAAPSSNSAASPVAETAWPVEQPVPSWPSAGSPTDPLVGEEPGRSPGTHWSPDARPAPGAPTSSSTSALVTAKTVPPVAFPHGFTHRSTPAERDQVRVLLGGHWDTYAPSVRRAFTRLPALGAGDLAAAAVDLVALSLYLDDDVPVTASLTASFTQDDRAAYHSCLASALTLLPTHRGVVVRGVDASRLRDQGPLAPGRVLTATVPAGGTALTGTVTRPPATAMYVIRSQTARILHPLLDEQRRAGDVMFAPGTRLAVLDTQHGGRHGMDVVFLQELPATSAAPVPEPSVALSELRQAMNAATLTPAGGGEGWPGYAMGVLAEAETALAGAPGVAG
ncbi:hypothetical protein KIH74_14650 [Kineosporia sp. J2-2]|uniref:Uncharacterized protein n=1 Tax=Kineosporia corallincola TaxID=2835133 RepID=A0ABS5TGJ1_9ACTN|nr:hypothetical protein [Kineosporia corallincola]MBT0770177.1 hypothetical protein [Kineosporia corallincola]